MPKEPVTHDLVRSLITGTVIAGLFNPWDRALYLSTSNNRPFLFDNKRRRLFFENLQQYQHQYGNPPYQFLKKFPGFVYENFQKPYNKFMQSIFSRIISSGIYFFMQSQMDSSLYVYLHEKHQWEKWQAKGAVGLTAGGVAGAVSNWLYAIRAYSWDHQTHFFESTKRMYIAGGLSPFCKGLYTIILRDVTFGICNELLRYQVADKHNTFAWNFLAGSIAATISSPLNYARTIKFATLPGESAPNITTILADLCHDAKACSSLPNKPGFFQQKLNIGWGTVRVGVSMAIGQQLFGLLKTIPTQKKEGDTNHRTALSLRNSD